MSLHYYALISDNLICKSRMLEDQGYISYECLLQGEHGPRGPAGPNGARGPPVIIFYNLYMGQLTRFQYHARVVGQDLLKNHAIIGSPPMKCHQNVILLAD